MDPVPAFIIVLIMVSVFIPKLGPFLSLVISALIFGFLTGMGPELLEYMAAGLGRIFSALAVVVFSGAIIAEYLRQTGSIERIVADLRRISKNSLLVSGVAGYIVALPVMCSITAFMILEPLMSCLGRESGGEGKRLLFMTSAASIISFNLIYPSPVMVSLADSLEAEPSDILTMSLPLSLFLLGLAYLYMRGLAREPVEKEECPLPGASRMRAWLPLAFPMALILLGLAVVPERPEFKLLGSPSLALLLGAIFCLALARQKVEDMVHTATRRSGVILLDLCGAGAFGFVISQSQLGQSIHALLGDLLPILALPFLVSSLLQLAQGSRVVTVVIASQILSGYPLEGPIMALLIASGAFMFSYVTDPYFWLVKEYTGASIKEMVRGYTLPLSLLGLAGFGAAVLYSML